MLWILQKAVELDEVLLSDVQSPTLSELYVQDFFVVMALCNTVVVTGKSHIHSIDEGEWVRLVRNSAHFLSDLLAGFLLSSSPSLFSPAAHLHTLSFSPSSSPRIHHCRAQAWRNGYLHLLHNLRGRVS